VQCKALQPDKSLKNSAMIYVLQNAVKIISNKYLSRERHGLCAQRMRISNCRRFRKLDFVRLLFSPFNHTICKDDFLSSFSELLGPQV
jgi:hypothetical protein